jgi:hypothetical protein
MWGRRQLVDATATGGPDTKVFLLAGSAAACADHAICTARLSEKTTKIKLGRAADFALGELGFILARLL